MKKVFSIIMIFLVFSCATKPEPEEEAVEPEIAETAEEQIEDQTEEAVDEFPDGFQNEITKAGINNLPFEITELPVEEPPAPPPVVQEPPPVQEPLPVEEPPQAQVQALPEEPPPVQEQRPRLPPAPQSPPPSPPRQTPPVSPPATLGPAEEITKEREPFITPRAEQERESFARIESIPPSAAIAPQEGGEIVFSRIVRATVGQLIEIPFRGTGWVYLGEIASRRGIAYDSRRIDPEGQSFIFRAEEAGTYSLKFFRQDFIRDYILNDHVQVIVGEAPTAGAGWFNPPRDSGRVTAEPRWPSVLDEAHIPRGALVTPGSIPSAPAAPRDTAPSTPVAPSAPVAPTTPAVQGGTAPAVSTAPVAPTAPATPSAPARETTPAQPPSASAVQPSATSDTRPPVTASGEPPSAGAVSENRENLSPELILQKAKEAFDGGNAQAAIALLDQYAQIFPSGTDELYWYYGQFYEANTPSRNILLSLEYYRLLVNEFPQSSRLNDARRRISYLERFYINIQ
jgi:hypothetical protein